MRSPRSRRHVDVQTAAVARDRVARLTAGPGVVEAEGENDTPAVEPGAVRRGDGDGDDESGSIGRDQTHDVRPSRPQRVGPPWVERIRTRLAMTRMGLERGHAMVVVVAIVVAVIAAAVLWVQSRPRVQPVEPEVVSTGDPLVSDQPDERVSSVDDDAAEDSSPPLTSSDDGPITVHVAGLVVRPGVVELPAGSRVVDAIDEVGGVTSEADLTPINLARVLADGEQVVVTATPVTGSAPPSAPAVAGTDERARDPVNLNTATLSDLDTLPGIGPTLAERILRWREENGRFRSVDELREVTGIGERRFADLTPLVTL